MFSSKCETFASHGSLRTGGGTIFKVAGISARQKTKIFVIWIGNCDVTRTEIWCH